MVRLIALLLLITPAFAADEQGHRDPDKHKSLHAFYQDLFNNKKNISCCHNQDCRPTTSRMIGDHYEVLINGTWKKVEQDDVIPKSAPDGGAHICAGIPSSMDPLGRIYCVVLPPET